MSPRATVWLINAFLMVFGQKRIWVCLWDNNFYKLFNVLRKLSCKRDISPWQLERTNSPVLRWLTDRWSLGNAVQKQPSSSCCTHCGWAEVKPPVDSPVCPQCRASPAPDWRPGWAGRELCPSRRCRTPASTSRRWSAPRPTRWSPTSTTRAPARLPAAHTDTCRSEASGDSPEGTTPPKHCCFYSQLGLKESFCLTFSFKRVISDKILTFCLVTDFWK